MDTIWTRHRFSGGALALDVANTIVLRADPARRIDRFADAAEIVRFAAAAGTFRADEIGGCTLIFDKPENSRAGIIELRETIDALFRAEAGEGSSEIRLLPPLLKACAAALEGQDGRVGVGSGFPRGRMKLAAAVALSALSLLDPARRSRIRICANCDWLFVDASRNGSRRWCDMTVCGNRQKARRHSQRQRAGRTEEGHG